MERFTYYQIEGFLPSSFISHELGTIVKFADRQKAIDKLEDVLKKWKVEMNGEYFNSNGEFINDAYEDKLFGNYRHQFVFKNKNGIYY